MGKKILSIFLKAFISLALIIILLYMMRGKYLQIWDAMKGASPALLLLGLTAFLLATVVASCRLKLIVDALDVAKATLSEVISLTFIGYFFNNFLPTSIGGDVAKAYYLSRKNSSKLPAFTAVFVDRVIGLVTMIFMAAAALLFAQNQIIDKNVRYAIYAVTVCSIIAILFVVNKKFAKRFSALLMLVRPLEESLRKIYNAMHIYKNHTSLIMKSLAISVVSQILFFVSIGVLAVSIGAVIPPMEILLRMPIICVVSLLPSINGLGVREGSIVVLFGPIIGKENAFVIGILWFLVLFVTSVAGGLVYAFSPQFKIKWKDLAKEEKG
ncbi:MAG: lysylphosphatidylglycerol synthase transmembrane domain-containing protein [Candidatus Omnitrophica bacterium]|nr:lysylphosphatidylglycerol synthase transmembrane domain-containing protein [Candidatus Omnitrophota bacterium]